MIKKFSCLALAFAFLLSLTACASEPQSTASDSSTASTTSEVSESSSEPSSDASSSTADDATDSDTITIVDHTGNEVTIPSKIERVVIDQIPVASTYVMYHGGECPYLVGMSGSVVDVLSQTVAAEVCPELLEVDTSYYDNGELNVETLLTLEPDVVLYNAGNTEHFEMFQQAGIPAVGFTAGGDPTTMYADWLRLLEQVFQEPGKMDDLIEYGETLVDDVKARTADLTEEEIKDVMVLFSYSDGNIRVAGETPFFGYYWLQTINARNAAVGATEALAPVNLEQIYTWDPDVVVMPGAGHCKITPEQVMENKVDGADFTPLKAVQEGKVYTNELGMWSWFTPNPDAPIVARWLGKVVYPELFEDVDLAAETKEYYSRFYGYELSDEQIAEIYPGIL